MKALRVKFAPLGREEYEYSIIPRDDTYLILIDGVEACSIKMRQDGTDIWETCGDAGLTDEEIDFLSVKIRNHYL